MADLDGAALLPGFADPVIDAQASFRAVLAALSYPGRIQRLGRLARAPAPLDAATAAVALTLFDLETPVWLDAAAASGPAGHWLKFHCGCPIVAAPQAASFAVIAGALPELGAFPAGEDAYPERSCTLVVQVPALTGGPVRRIAGPGIRGEGEFAVAGLPADFPVRWAANRRRFPLGVDLILAAGGAIIGLPRSTEMR